MHKFRTFRAHHPRWGIAASALILGFVELSWLLHGPITTPLDSYRTCATAGYPLTDTNPPACDSGGQVFLGPAATPMASLPPLAAQAFQPLVNGDSGGRYPKGQQIITNQTDWQTYWRQVHAALPSMPPLIAVDFTTHDVIALSSGPEATGGYMLRVAGVQVGPAGSVVNVIESVPTVTCIVTESFTDRYFIAQTAKLPPPVTFTVTIEHRQC